MVTIVDGKKRIPFMRGMLVHHLIQLGFDDEESYEVADAVRAALRQKKDVPAKEMLALIDETLTELCGRTVEDLRFWEPTRRASVSVSRGKSKQPFSKEILSNSLQASGLPPENAFEIAREIEELLISEGRGEVTEKDLEELAVELLAERHEPSYAERYSVWRAWNDLEKPLIILIGGASGVGKTSLAIDLAHLLGIPRVVATDDIRQIMRLTLAPEFLPTIHTSSYAAEATARAPEDGALDPLIAGFREQARIVGVGVQAILTRCVEENTSIIIDGVHLVPGLVDTSAFADGAFVTSLTLVVSDRGDWEDRFAKRAAEAPGRSARKYVSHLDGILKIQEHIVEWSASEGIPVIDTTAVDDATSAAVMVVVESLQEEGAVKKDLRAGGQGKGKKGGKKK